MKVRATKMYEILKVKDKELDKILKEGEEFEISEERFKVLAGKNNYNAIFVERIEEIETAIKKIKTEKAIKKTAKKIKQDDI